LILATVLVVLVILFGYGALLIYSDHPDEPNFVLRPGLLYLSYFGLVALFLVSISLSYELTTVDANPKTALADLAHRLRVSRYRVKEDSKGLKVQVTSSTAIRIIAKETRGRTVIGYKLDQTPSGWTALIILLFMFYLAIVTVVLTIYAIWVVQRFAQNAVLPRVVGVKRTAEEGPSDVIKSTLVDGLSEGYRLASEAYEAQYSNYQDGILAVMTGGLFVWFLSFMSFFVLIRGHSLYEDVEGSLVASIIVTLLFSLLPMVYLTRKVKIKALEFRSWSDKLLARLQQETGVEPPKEDQTSAFELLAKASKETPKWMKVMRRAGLFTDPWTWFAIFMLAYVAFQLILAGIATWYSNNLILQATLFAGGIVAAFCCFLLYRRWITKAREEETTTITNWEARLRTVREKMQRHLEEL